MSDTIEIDTKGLDKFLKAIKGDLPIARVGILGNGNARSGKGINSNAEVGALWEYPSTKRKWRSFLRVPITDNMQAYLDKSGVFTKDVLAQVIKTGSIFAWVQKIGVIGERIVADGFDSGGFGKWPPSDMRFKKNHQTLIETQQLRNSISSDVK